MHFFPAPNFKRTYTHELMRQKPNNLIIIANMMQKIYAVTKHIHMKMKKKSEHMSKT